MKINQSYLIHYGIILSILLNNHFFRLIDFNGLAYIQIFLIILLNIIALIQNSNKRKRIIFIYELFVFIFIIILQFVMECLVRGKTFTSFISVITVYSYVFLLFPLCVQYEKYCDFMKIVKVISVITFINLFVASLVSILYTYFDYPITINYYKTVAAVRNNRIRLSDLDVFLGISFAYLLSSFCIWRNRNNTVKKIIHILVFAYACFCVQQTRVIELTLIIMCFVAIFLKCKNSPYKNLYIICFIAAMILIIPTQYTHIKNLFIDSFSIHGTKGTSTMMRIEEIKYAINQIKENYLCGYGVTNAQINNVITIKYKGIKYLQTYSNVDIGMVGSIAMLGISYLVFYVIPLLKFYFVLRKVKKITTDIIFAYCIFAFLVCTSFTIVVTDGSRIYAWPYYLCFFYTFQIKGENKYDKWIISQIKNKYV